MGYKFKNDMINKAFRVLDDKEFKAFQYLLWNCNKQPSYTVKTPRGPINLRFGQYMTNSTNISKTCRCSRQQAHRILVSLEKKGFIKRTTMVKFTTIVTILTIFSDVTGSDTGSVTAKPLINKVSNPFGVTEYVTGCDTLSLDKESLDVGIIPDRIFG